MNAGRSISSRLTIWFSSVYFAGLALFGIAMWFNLEHTLTQTRVRTLERRADRLIEVLRKTEGDTPQQREKKFQAFAEATGGGLMEVFQPDRSRALPSPSQDAASFPWPQIRALRQRQVYRDIVRRPTLSGSGTPVALSVRSPDPDRRRAARRPISLCCARSAPACSGPCPLCLLFPLSAATSSAARPSGRSTRLPPRRVPSAS